MKIVPPAAITPNMKVGDLLKNADREGKVFGRITLIEAGASWVKIHFNPDDKGE